MPRVPKHRVAPKVPTMLQVFSLIEYIYSEKALGSNMGTPNLFHAPDEIKPRNAPVSHRGLLAKIPALLLAPAAIFLRALPKIHDHK